MPQSTTLTDQTFSAHLAAADRLVVVDFWAPWCGPCRVIAPVLERLAEELADRAEFAKLNVDENPETAAAHGVQSIPTLLFFRDGELVDRTVGALPESIIHRKIEQLVPAGTAKQ